MFAWFKKWFISRNKIAVAHIVPPRPTRPLSIPRTTLMPLVPLPPATVEDPLGDHLTDDEIAQIRRDEERGIAPPESDARHLRACQQCGYKYKQLRAS